MKPPKKHRSFESVAAELNYLNDAISYWWHHSSKPNSAIRFRNRFATLLAARETDDGSIALQEHWALLREVDGDIPKAIFHRAREIALLERALRLGGPIDEIDHSYLAEKYMRLSILHGQNGNRRSAIRCFSKAKQLAARHGFKLTGQALLGDEPTGD